MKRQAIIASLTCLPRQVKERVLVLKILDWGWLVGQSLSRAGFRSEGEGCCYWNHDNPVDKISCVQVAVVCGEETLGGWKETMSAIGNCSNPISFDYSRTITSLVMV